MPCCNRFCLCSKRSSISVVFVSAPDRNKPQVNSDSAPASADVNPHQDKTLIQETSLPVPGSVLAPAPSVRLRPGSCSQCQAPSWLLLPVPGSILAPAPSARLHPGSCSQCQAPPWLLLPVSGSTLAPAPSARLRLGSCSRSGISVSGKRMRPEHDQVYGPRPGSLLFNCTHASCASKGRTTNCANCIQARLCGRVNSEIKEE